MIRLTAIPREGANLYNLLTSKEVALRKKKQGTLHRSGGKKSGTEKWKHSSLRAGSRSSVASAGRLPPLCGPRRPMLSGNC